MLFVVEAKNRKYLEVGGVSLRLRMTHSHLLELGKPCGPFSLSPAEMELEGQSWKVVADRLTPE
jgi:hypothetical protein